MKLESGTCSQCGEPIHLTRRCGWLHDKHGNTVDHKAQPAKGAK